LESSRNTGSKSSISQATNEFPDWLSRTCLDELYSYNQYRKVDVDKFEVLVKGQWKRLVPTVERRKWLVSFHTNYHLGYTKMMAEVKEANITWPGLAEEVMDFLSDCSCALTKTNKRRTAKWTSPQLLKDLQNPRSYALDIYSYAGLSYLSILHLDTDEFWSLQLADKSQESVLDLLTSWSDSLDLDLKECTFMTDRGAEFNNLMQAPGVTEHIRTAAYHPQANGSVERKHRELSAMCRLYGTTPDRISNLWRTGGLSLALKSLPEVGELVLRYVPMVNSKEVDRWSGPYKVLKQTGLRMLEAVNLETGKISVLHINDVKAHRRPATSLWQTSKDILEEFVEQLDEAKEWTDAQSLSLDDSWKAKVVFVDINASSDLEQVFAKALKELPAKLYIVVPEFRERAFWKVHEGIYGDFVQLPHDQKLFHISSDPCGLFSWNSWFGVYKEEDLRAANHAGWHTFINRLQESGEEM